MWRRNIPGAVGHLLQSLLLLPFCVLLVVLKLPVLLCERFRWFRYLPYVGLAYFGIVISLVLMEDGFSWPAVALSTSLLAFGSQCSRPDPFSFLFCPRKRRAVRLAIEHCEAMVGHGGSGPIYATVRVIGAEAGKTIVSVAMHGRPPWSLFFSVSDVTSNIEDLSFEYVMEKFKVVPWRKYGIIPWR